MMKTRLSARAADAASRNAQAMNADMGRMGHRRERGSASSNRPKVLIMINHGAGMPGLWRSNPLQNGRKADLTPWPGLGHGGTMNGLLAICSICREIIS